jgi:2-methylcitrate dehydratase PrpD
MPRRRSDRNLTGEEEIMKATESIANFVTTTSWNDVPEEAYQRSKWAILDCLAAGFAGVQHDVGEQIVSAVIRLLVPRRQGSTLERRPENVS